MSENDKNQSSNSEVKYFNEERGRRLPSTDKTIAPPSVPIKKDDKK